MIGRFDNFDVQLPHCYRCRTLCMVPLTELVGVFALLLIKRFSVNDTTRRLPVPPLLCSLHSVSFICHRGLEPLLVPPNIDKNLEHVDFQPQYCCALISGYDFLKQWSELKITGCLYFQRQY